MGIGRTFVGLLLLLFSLGAGAATDFVILNPKGEEVVPQDPKTKLSPFGLLLFDDNACTVSHIRFGEVLTNSHCVLSERLSDYSILYFDKHGGKQRAAISSIHYHGDPQRIDVALLTIAAADAEAWDSLDQAKLINPWTHAPLATLTMWAFDPIANYPELEAKFSNQAAVFNPKTCLVTSKQPIYRGLNPYTGKMERLGRDNPIPETRMYYDRCSSRPVPGNSGSLITNSENLFDVVGVHQSSLGPTEQQTYNYPFFKYETVENTDAYLSADEVPDSGLYWSGINLFSVQKLDIKLAHIFAN